MPEMQITQLTTLTQLPDRKQAIAGLSDEELNRLCHEAQGRTLRAAQEVRGITHWMFNGYDFWAASEREAWEHLSKQGRSGFYPTDPRAAHELLDTFPVNGWYVDNFHNGYAYRDGKKLVRDFCALILSRYGYGEQCVFISKRAPSQAFCRLIAEAFLYASTEGDTND